MKIPIRYLPKNLSKKDKKKQLAMLIKSRKSYKKHKYVSRSKLSSFHNKTSNHILDARKLYKIQNITPSPALSKVTGCSLSALKKIVNKGEGAYFSSGSRPNQSAQSWGLARLASSVTGGKSAAVDFNILEKSCLHNKPAYKLALKSRKKWKYGHSKTKKITL
jgi:hypothetical protein